MSSWVWGSNANNNVTVGTGEAAPVFTEEIKKKDIVKEGFLFK